MRWDKMGDEEFDYSGDKDHGEDDNEEDEDDN